LLNTTAGWDCAHGLRIAPPAPLFVRPHSLWLSARGPDHSSASSQFGSAFCTARTHSAPKSPKHPGWAIAVLPSASFLCYRSDIVFPPKNIIRPLSRSEPLLPIHDRYHRTQRHQSPNASTIARNRIQRADWQRAARTGAALRSVAGADVRVFRLRLRLRPLGSAAYLH